MSRITNYDEGGYSYEDYWRGRDYENRAELHAMQSMLDPYQTGWIADLGGGFGRLAPAYLGLGRPVMWVDYSMNLLAQAQARYGPPTPRRLYVAANLNYLPFRTGSLGTTLLIRVIHHLASHDRVLREVSRVAQKEWVIDIPQKLHALARFRSVIRSQWRVLHEEAPINLSRRPDHVFLNYHPRHIERRLSVLGWTIRESRSVSNLRSPCLKQRIGTDRLLSVERRLQPRLASLQFGPNLWHALARAESSSSPATAPEDILVCPECHGTLELQRSDAMACPSCQQPFICRDGVWDFRWPRPSTL